MFLKLLLLRPKCQVDIIRVSMALQDSLFVVPSSVFDHIFMMSVWDGWSRGESEFGQLGIPAMLLYTVDYTRATEKNRPGHCFDDVTLFRSYSGLGDWLRPLHKPYLSSLFDQWHPQ